MDYDKIFAKVQGLQRVLCKTRQVNVNVNPTSILVTVLSPDGIDVHVALFYEGQSEENVKQEYEELIQFIRNGKKTKESGDKAI